MRKGYKETKVGVIPEDWEVKKIGEITLEHKQGFYTKQEYKKDGNIKLVRITDLLNPKLSYETMPKLNVNENNFEAFKIFKGDFLFARSGAIGRFGIVEEEIPAIFASYIIRFQFDIKKAKNSIIGYIFSSKICQQQLKSISQGNANININAENIKQLQIPLPPLPEQEKIASILTTVDDKIELIDRQIESATELKKGLMQKLFSEGIGHKEFKDSPLGRIPVEWEVKRICEITTYVDYRGKTPRKTKNGIRLITARNVKKGYIDYSGSSEYINPDEYKTVMSRGLPKLGDVLITTEAPYGNIAQVNNCDIALAQRIIKYRGNDNLNNNYLKYYMLSQIFQNQLDFNSTGGTVKGIKGSRLHKLFVFLPSLSEQQQIAAILSSADDKISILKEKKLAYTKLKKGLMQKLLTGEVRVKINE